MARKAARGSAANGSEIISPARWTEGHFLDVAKRSYQIGPGGQVAIGLVVLNSPELLRGFDLGKILDANLSLSPEPALDEVWDGNRYDQADNRDHDHDFDQSERCFG